MVPYNGIILVLDFVGRSEGVLGFFLNPFFIFSLSRFEINFSSKFVWWYWEREGWQCLVRLGCAERSEKSEILDHTQPWARGLQIIQQFVRQIIRHFIFLEVFLRLFECQLYAEQQF